MQREENGVNFTLFETNFGNNNSMYSIQLNTNLGSANYGPCGQRIIQKPSANGEVLKLQLYVDTGNASHVEHKFELGLFPNNINKWKLEIEYMDAQNAVIKDVKTEQAEGEAEPRPIKEGTLG